jgi:hypothetical protein
MPMRRPSCRWSASGLISYKNKYIFVKNKKLIINSNRVLIIVFFVSFFSLLFIFTKGASALQYYCWSNGITYPGTDGSLADPGLTSCKAECVNTQCSPQGQTTNNFITYRNGSVCHNANSATGGCTCPSGTGPEEDPTINPPFAGCSSGYNETCFPFRCVANSNGSFSNYRSGAYCGSTNSMTGSCSLATGCPSGSSPVLIGTGWYCSSFSELCAFYDCQPHQTPGVCGSALGQSYVYNNPPSGSLACSSGSFGGTTDLGASWEWFCNGSGGGSNAHCYAYKHVILTFTASPTTITQGNSSTLSWATNYASSCSGVGGNGGWPGAKPVNGSQTVWPASPSTTYGMTCYNVAGAPQIAAVAVTVNAVPAPTLVFSASPNPITAGSSSTLSWTATNAVSCTASSGWSGAKSTTSGSEQVTPGSTTSYTLQCWNSVNVSITRIVTVTVNPPASCNLPWGGSIAHNATVTAYQAGSVACGASCVSQTRTCNNGTLSGTYTNQNCTVAACPLATVTLTASPATIPSGSPSTLTWTTNNAVNGCWAWGGGIDGWKANSNGAHNQSVSPASTTTYSIECWNADGVSSGVRNATVTVTVPTLTFSASPTTITQGNASTLTWNVQNATSCWGDGTGFSNWQLSTNGSHNFQVYPPATETFYLECWNANGVSSGRKSAAITVNPLPSPTLALTASPNPVTVGSSSTITWTPSNVTSCTASGGLGGWSGSKAATGGNQSFNIPGNTTFSMSCVNSVGTSTGVKNVTVTVTAPSSCVLPWGGSIASGATVTAYQASSVPCGSSCVSETRTCNNGVLSGTYINQNCTPVPCPSSCVLPWGGSIAHLASVTAYQASSVPCGSICVSQTRTCNNGTLSGTYTNVACSVTGCLNCTSPWGSAVSHGGAVTAYQNPSVPCGSNCASESRLCNNGTLVGSYTNQNCSVQACPVGGSGTWKEVAP